MEVLKSKKVKLPVVYFITDREEIKELPMGVPFIYGAEEEKSFIIRLMEYEVLYLAAIKTGLPFNFEKILEDNGFRNLKRYGYNSASYLEYTTSGDLEDEDIDLSIKTTVDLNSSGAIKNFIEDSAVVVDIQKLKNLKIIPIWLDNLEKAIASNLHNCVTYNPYMYNKKLGGMYGSVELAPPTKSLIIVDISGSIPRGVSATCLSLAKNMAENFHADLLITGTISTLYPYADIHTLNINTIYEVNGMNNDQTYFKKLVTSEVKEYNTAIVFGDDHSPCYPWQSASSEISREDGRKMCKWKIDKLVSFHTKNTEHIAGYADWFTPKQVEKIGDWVKYL